MLGKAVLLLAGLCLVGCAPGIHIRRVVPAAYNLGATRKVAMLEVQGEPRAAMELAHELQRQITRRGHFAFYNAIERGLRISVTGAGARVEIGGIRQEVEADVYLSALVLASQAREVEEKQGAGEAATVKLRPEATVKVNFQVVKADGRVLVFQDYESTKQGEARKADQPPGESALLRQQALSEVVGNFLRDITPRMVTEKIELDDAQPLKPGIQRAEQGDLAGAEQAWKSVLEKDPGHPGAIFNLGVLLEVNGEFEKAAEHYQRASSLSPKPLYRQALENLQRRMADLQALQRRL